LLIVVAIILIIAAIAIPNLLRARMAAYEASAVGSMRTINTSAVTYSSTWGVQFPTWQAVIGGATGVAATCALAELIDPTVARRTLELLNSDSTLTYLPESPLQSRSAE
jgi:type II secretory pathway pseudopilin PulG